MLINEQTLYDLNIPIPNFDISPSNLYNYTNCGAIFTTVKIGSFISLVFNANSNLSSLNYPQ